MYKSIFYTVITFYAGYMKKVLLFILLTSLTQKSFASNFIEYGFTPSHVHALWVSINNSILELSKKYPLDVQNQVKGVKARQYNNKIPADVLNETNIFTRKLNNYRTYYNLPDIDLKSMEEDSSVTPSTVFINSGRLQDELARTILKSNPQQMLSPIYQSNFILGKVPSDVYSLVELSIEQLKILISSEKEKNNLPPVSIN